MKSIVDAFVVTIFKHLTRHREVMLHNGHCYCGVTLYKESYESEKTDQEKKEV